MWWRLEHAFKHITTQNYTADKRPDKRLQGCPGQAVLQQTRDCKGAQGKQCYRPDKRLQGCPGQAVLQQMDRCAWGE